MADKQPGEAKSKMDLLLQLSSGVVVEEDNRTASEIITDSLSNIAETYSWELDTVTARSSEDFPNYSEFTFRNGGADIVVSFEMDTGVFVGCKVINTILSPSIMFDAFQRLGTKP